MRPISFRLSLLTSPPLKTPPSSPLSELFTQLLTRTLSVALLCLTLCGVQVGLSSLWIEGGTPAQVSAAPREPSQGAAKSSPKRSLREKTTRKGAKKSARTAKRKSSAKQSAKRSVAPPPLPDLSPSALQRTLERLSEGFKRGGAQGSHPTPHPTPQPTPHIAWHLRSLKGDEVYASSLAEVTTHPASTNKLATTAVAYLTLSPAFTYETSLWADLPPSAPPVQELSQGDQRGEAHAEPPAELKALPPITLYWEASGDLKITSEVYQAWVKQLKAAGVRSVKGLVIDDHLFTDQPLAPGYELKPDDDAAYRAATGGVSYNFNRLIIKLKPGKVGAAPRVSLSPKIKHALILNEGKTVATGREALKVKSFMNAEGKLVIEVSGTIPARVKGKRFRGVSVARRAPNPLLFSGEALLEALQEGGVQVKRGARVRRGELPKPEQRRALLTHRSEPLKALLHDINTYSNNCMAEQLLLTLGLHKRGFGGWREGVGEVRDQLKQRFKLKGFEYVNGSGLFGDAAFSPKQLTALLWRANKLTRGGFADVLPKSGREGTIKRRFKALPKGAVRAKTGTLDGVSTLCGYLQSRAADKLTFCVMMSGFDKARLREARALQDELVSAMWRLQPSSSKTAPQ